MTQSRRSFLKLTATGTLCTLPVLSACSQSSISGPPRGLSSATTPSNAADFLSAVRTGDLLTVRRFLDAEPSLLGVVDELDRSAFALAVLNRHKAVSTELVTRGYLPDAHEAALDGDWERFSSLTEGDLSIVHRDHPLGGTAMYAAALGGTGADIWRVYAATGEPNEMARGGRGDAPLQAALRFPDLATAEMTAAALLGNAADPNPITLSGESPLHIAARRGSLEMVEMLIRRGADVSARDARGQTAIEVAQRAGQTAVATLLSEHDRIPRTCTTSRTAYDAQGARYIPPDISDLPIVDRARFVGNSHSNLDYVQAALAKEPQLVHAVTTNSEICVEACAHTGRTAIVELLLEHGAVYSLPTAVVMNDTKRVKQLLDQDPQRIQERGAHDFALLWYPVLGQCGIDMMQLLLDRGGDIEQQHHLGTTALHWACMQGPIELVDFLIEHGADVNRRGRKFNAAGETPLQLAARSDQPAISDLLRSRGASD